MQRQGPFKSDLRTVAVSGRDCRAAEALRRVVREIAMAGANGTTGETVALPQAEGATRKSPKAPGWLDWALLLKRVGANRGGNGERVYYHGFSG